MSDKIYDLKDRTFKFAQRMLDITEQLPRKPESEIVRKQLARAGTSIGANIEEAEVAQLINILSSIINKTR